jgi:hypothetical protein
MTAVVFGSWLLVAGLVPLAWGAWTWLTGARDELAATIADEHRHGDPVHADSKTPEPR